MVAARSALVAASACCSLVLGSLAVAQHSHPAAHEPFLGLTSADLPARVRLAGVPRRYGSVFQMDAGVPSATRQDRLDGFRAGLVQDLRDGDRRIRVLARLYDTSRGAAHAYLLAARYLGAVLPDPVLRVRLERLPGVGSAATLATYQSGPGASRYTVSALVFLAGNLVGQVEAFPLARHDGLPGRDRLDLTGVGRSLARMLADATTRTP